MVPKIQVATSDFTKFKKSGPENFPDSEFQSTTWNVVNAAHLGIDSKHLVQKEEKRMIMHFATSKQAIHAVGEQPEEQLIEKILDLKS